MKKIRFKVQGSTDEPYNVSINKSGNKIQNLKLLEMIAKDNFIQEKNKREFIDRCKMVSDARNGQLF